MFHWTHEAGILVTANYMLGLPGETREDLQMTLDLAAELEVLDFGRLIASGTPDEIRTNAVVLDAYLGVKH